MNNSELIRTISTLGAVLLGFALAQFADWIKSKKNAKKNKKAVRCLISLEVNSNIMYIRDFQKNIFEDTSLIKPDGDFPYSALADRAARISFPPITVAAWQANLKEVATTYTETELEAIYSFQNKLARLNSLHLLFCEAQTKRQQTIRAGNMINNLNFAASTKEPSKEFKSLLDDITLFDLQKIPQST